jgi:hypothetical protein
LTKRARAERVHACLVEAGSLRVVAVSPTWGIGMSSGPGGAMRCVSGLPLERPAKALAGYRPCRRRQRQPAADRLSKGGSAAESTLGARGMRAQDAKVETGGGKREFPLEHLELSRSMIASRLR